MSVHPARVVGRLAPLAAVIALVLTGCAPTATSEPTPSTVAPTPDATPSAASPTPEPTADAISVPDVCAAIDLEPGGELLGTDLGPCIEAVVAMHDTGSVELTSPDVTGTVHYSYTPQFALAAQLETGDGPVEMSLVDGVMLLSDGGEVVVGDPESEDPDEHRAGITGELYRVFADPGFVGDLISEGEVWNVASETETIATTEGASVTAYRIGSAAAYSWFDIPIDELTLWVTAEWAPVAVESTTGFFGRTATVRQDFSALGEPVTIEPLD